MDDTELRVYRTHIVGLLTCKTGLDPFEVVHKLKEYADENPYQFRYAIKFTPLEFCVPSTIDEIKQATESLLHKIGEDASFRVTVKRRHTKLESMEVVKAVAAVIHREVDLDNPDHTVWVEVVGELAGISVLNRETDILSIMTMRGDQY